MSNKNKSIILSRKELYKLVWSQPISKILKEYPISNTAFNKICKENDIPLPKNGHWQKLKFNKDVIIIPLPKSDKTNKEIFLSEQVKGLSELNQLIREIKNDKSLPLKVPEEFIKTDRIIVRTKKYFNESSKVKYPKTIEEPKEGVFSIYVSKSLERRAYLFADTLIKLVRARGHDVAVVTDHKYHNYNGTKLIIFGEYFNIRIREPDNRIMEKHERYDWKEAKYYPSGKLTLNYDRRLYGNTWSDTETKLLEDKLPNILAFFEIRAKKKKQDRIESEIRQRENEIKRKIEEDFKTKRKKELESFISVISHSSRWQKAMDLRNYIQTVESNAISNGKMNEELKEWLLWIKNKADWYDPLIEKEDELFENIDRDTLLEIKRSWY